MPLQANLKSAQDINHVHMGLVESPLHARTSKLNINQQWINWNGFAAASYYRDAHIEYFSTRNTCGVFDVSPMRKYRFKGPDAEAMLNRMVTRDVSIQPINTVAYNVWCTDKGRVVDDGTLFRLADDEFMVCCAMPCLDWFLMAKIGFNELSITDISDDLAAVAIQGPTSCAVLKAMGFTGIENAKPFEIMEFSYLDTTIMISRTGFTGDLGYELWIKPDKAIAMWDHLFDTGQVYGIQPLGDESLDLARLEAGFIAPDIDFHSALHTVRQGHDHSPLELGLGWILNFNKPHFTGRAALLVEKENGNHRRLVKLDIAGNKPAQSSILYRDEALTKPIGYITSAMWSPVVKANIAYGLVDSAYFKGPIYAEIYYQKELRWYQKVAKCKRVTKPFWAPSRAKLTPPLDH